ncbi:hypothetical protein Tco_0825881 [Tanacetum coccineum]
MGEDNNGLSHKVAQKQQWTWCAGVIQSHDLDGRSSHTYGRSPDRRLGYATACVMDFGLEVGILTSVVGESQLIGPELVQEMTEKIFQIKGKVDNSKKSSGKLCLNKRRKPLEFKVVEERVLLKVSPWKSAYDLVRRENWTTSGSKCLWTRFEIDENLDLSIEPIEDSGTRCEEALKAREDIPLVKVRWNSRYMELSILGT